MKNPFSKLSKKAEAEEQPKKKFASGLVIGLVIAAIVLAIALVVFFMMRGKGDQAGGTQTDLKFTVVTSKNCGKNCWDTQLFFDVLDQGGLKYGKPAIVTAESGKGKELVKQYAITKVPTIIASGNLESDEQLKSFFSALGEIKDGVFVLRQVIPPYYDLASSSIKGQVQITYITDSACAECYDVKIHDRAFTYYGVPTSTSRTVDAQSAEGKTLIAKYGIKAVPTVVISGEVGEYQSLSSVWPNFGTIAADGSLVFTQMDLIGGKYFDLQTNQVITPKPVATSTSDTTTAQ